MKRTHPFPLLVLLAGMAMHVGCQKERPETAEQTSAAETTPEPRTGPPVLEELQAMTFRGIQGLEPVTLQDGRWKGPPIVEGAASRPEVLLLGDLLLTGDVDADGADETVVLLNLSTGGTGQLLHLAVAKRVDGAAQNVATTFIGDRVQVRAARIEAGDILLDVVQAGPDDAMCCPGELATRGWKLQASGELQALEAVGATGRLTLESIAGTEWVLRFWEWGVPAPLEPEVTLQIEDTRIAGKNGCNNYFATVTAGEAPGDMSLGPAGATRMACTGTAAAVESRFMQQFEGVTKYGFMLTRLALTYEVDGRHGVMLFEPRQAESSAVPEPETP
jgi:heat shock protein HslJ